MVEQGRSDPFLGMVCADTDNPVYQIEISERKKCRTPIRSVFATLTLLRARR